MSSNNTTTPEINFNQKLLSFKLSSNGQDKYKKEIMEAYDLNDDRFVLNIVESRLRNNLTLEDLGEYFYNADDFDGSEYIGDNTFLIYFDTLNLFISIFWDEFVEICEEYGTTDRMCFNSVIQNAVTEYQASL